MSKKQTLGDLLEDIKFEDDSIFFSKRPSSSSKLHKVESKCEWPKVEEEPVRIRLIERLTFRANCKGLSQKRMDIQIEQFLEEPRHVQKVVRVEKKKENFYYRTQLWGFPDDQLVPLKQEQCKIKEPHIYVPFEPHRRRIIRPPILRELPPEFQSMIARRERKGGEIDLGVCTIDEVVEECSRVGLLALGDASDFLSQNGTLNIKRFLKSYQDESLSQFNFARTMFTLLDHRRLSQLLLHFRPYEYTIGSIDSLHLDIRDFLRKTYSLSDVDYVKAYKILDSLSGLEWWQKIRIRYQDSEHTQYFLLKEKLDEPLVPIQQYHSAQARAAYLKQIVGTIKLASADAELEKILAMKAVKNVNRGFAPQETAGFLQQELVIHDPVSRQGEPQTCHYEDLSSHHLDSYRRNCEDLNALQASKQHTIYEQEDQQQKLGTQVISSINPTEKTQQKMIQNKMETDDYIIKKEKKQKKKRSGSKSSKRSRKHVISQQKQIVQNIINGEKIIKQQGPVKRQNRNLTYGRNKDKRRKDNDRKKRVHR